MSNVATLDAAASLQGQAFVFENDAQRRALLNEAADYRGDVTLQFKNGETLEGYLFNHIGNSVQIYVKGVDQPRELQTAEISGVTFSGKDPADGRSYEAWKNKKASQRQAEIDAHEADMKAKGYL